jgi:hypothetical protein
VTLTLSNTKYNYGCDLATNNLIVDGGAGQGWLRQTMTANGSDAGCMSDWTYAASGTPTLQSPPALWSPANTGLSIAPYYSAEVFGTLPIPPSSSGTTIIETSLRVARGSKADGFFALVACARAGYSVFALSRTGICTNQIEVDIPEVNSSPGSGPQYAQYLAHGSLQTSGHFSISPSIQSDFARVDVVWRSGSSMELYVNGSLVTLLRSPIPSQALYPWYGLRPTNRTAPTVPVSNEIDYYRVCTGMSRGHTTCP